MFFLRAMSAMESNCAELSFFVLVLWKLIQPSQGLADPVQSLLWCGAAVQPWIRLPGKQRNSEKKDEPPLAWTMIYTLGPCLSNVAAVAAPCTSQPWPVLAELVPCLDLPVQLGCGQPWSSSSNLPCSACLGRVDCIACQGGLAPFSEDSPSLDGSERYWLHKKLFYKASILHGNSHPNSTCCFLFHCWKIPYLFYLL